MASSPAPSGLPPSAPSPFEAPPSSGPEQAMARLMQIKILYTFDDEKTNCLARCAQPVPVHTLQLEDNAEIGIVELRTCIRAIVAASPELVAKLGQDYTIYAYDYSEYETPLVGQGMLSWALASTSATPTAPADQSRTPVTGRVVKNVRSLFPNAGPSEILQVKLKLVPVPNALQDQYTEGMEKYRDTSNFASQGFDPAAWNAFLQARQNFATPNLQALPPQPMHSPLPQPSGPQSPAFYAPTAQSTNPQMPPQFFFQGSNAPPPPSSAPGPKSSSRPGTPRTRRPSVQSRPSSRASNRGGRQTQRQAPAPLQRIESAPAAVPTMSDVGDVDNAQSRKRARVEQADWRGPSVFDNSNEPLRVAASAAASIRGHRPSIPGHPTAADIMAAEPGVRPPTPRPSAPRLPRNESSEAGLPQKPRWYQSPYAMNADQSVGIGSEATSPQEDGMSAVSTPADIPSSPPVVHRRSLEPSSPQLPRPTNDIDSGFVSGTLDEFMNGDEEMRLGDDDDTKMATKYQFPRPGLPSEISFTEEVPGDPSLLPRNSYQTQRPKNPPRLAPRANRPGSVTPSSPRLPPLIPSRTEQTSPAPIFDTEPQFQSEAAQPPNLQRKDSMVNEQQSAAGLANDSGSDNNNVTTKAAGSGAKRSRAIQNRLQEDLAAGKMPPYCKNCGEIDTPTWRKCYTKEVDGTPDPARLAATEENMFTWDIIEHDQMGAATKYRIIKKSVGEYEFGYEQMQLCNSCGIWLFKFKTMRPREKWGKKPSNPAKPARKRPAKTKSASIPGDVKTDNLAMDADDQAFWSALTIDGVDTGNEFALTDVSGRSDKSMPKSTGKRRATTGAEPVVVAMPFLHDQSAADGLRRAIQSSPPKFPGSKGSPIDITKDETPQPLRRLLFPSPRKEGEMKTLDGIATQGSVVDPFADTFVVNKENGADSQKTPTKRTPRSKKTLEHLRTPTRSSPRLASKSVSRLSAQRRPQSNPETPSRAATHHTLPNPEMTPFTSQLNAMLSDGPNGFGAFDEGADPSGMFAFSDFANMDDFGLGNMGLPASDGDFFPVYEDIDGGLEHWNGGPLLEGELDELLKEAGEDAFMDVDGTGATPATGQTPAENGDGAGQLSFPPPPQQQ